MLCWFLITKLFKVNTFKVIIIRLKSRNKCLFYKPTPTPLHWRGSNRNLFLDFKRIALVSNRLTLNNFNITAKSHSSSKSLFSLHFVKTGKIDKKYGRLFSELFDLRQKSDYDNIYEYDEKSTQVLFKPVEEMLNEIKRYIFTNTN